MTSLSFQNPADDLRAEEDQLSLGCGPKVRQPLGEVSLADGPGRASEDLCHLRDGQRFAEQLFANFGLSS